MYLLRLLEKHNALRLPFSSSSPQLYRNIGEFGAKKYFRLFAAIKEIFLVYSSSGLVAAKGNSSETT